jgi:hypothetical protein
VEAAALGAEEEAVAGVEVLEEVAEAEDVQGEAEEAELQEVAAAEEPSSLAAERFSSGTRLGRGCAFRRRSGRSGSGQARVPTTWWVSHSA